MILSNSNSNDSIVNRLFCPSSLVIDAHSCKQLNYMVPKFSHFLSASPDSLAAIMFYSDSCGVGSTAFSTWWLYAAYIC